MQIKTLQKKIAQLPDNLKSKVEDFVDALMNQEGSNKADPKNVTKNTSIPRPVFGSGKGIFGKMADDFDAPLDQMKEYM